MFKFNILKSFIQKITIIKNQKKLFDSLNSGDLVWAKMPLSKKELNSIEVNHQIRPYLIVSKDRYNIYAYQSSSKQWNKLNNCQEYFINRFRYKQKKDSFINLTKVHKIPFVNLKTKYITLNEQDLKKVQKRLKIQTNNKYQFSIDIYILEGDVIVINHQLYYVYASDNVYLYCLVIFKKCPKDKKKYANIIINNKTYYTTFKEKVSFERTTKMNIVNIAYKSEMEFILEKKRGIELNQQKLSNLEKKMIEKSHELVYENGTVFQVGRNKIVYLFKYKNVHYGIDLLMYKIKPKTMPIYDIEKRPILEILPLEEFLKIVDFLCSNNVQPLKEINRLYDELRTVIYITHQ